MAEDARFLRLVRDALQCLHDRPRLQTHPLRAHLPPGAGGRGLQAALEEAVGALRPPPGTPPTARAVRIHRLLQLRYVEGLEPRAVWTTLGVGKTQYFREHGRGLAAVASVLQERWQSSPGAPRSAGPPRPGGSLPRPLTGLVGREREVAEATRLLGTGRLVTLTGPPGAGKTRLAVEAARALAPGFAAGVCFVPLGPLADPELVWPTVARCLGLRGAGGPDELAALVAALPDARLLLVLDNFEHVLDAAPLVGELLGACRALTVLVTSRAPLRVRGEQLLPVPPLALPDPGELPPLERLGACAAVRLFVERARAARPDFALTGGNAAAVAGVCRRLDGLPLAIELAAARSRLLPPAALLARLESAFGALALLTHGDRDLPERQQTLRRAIAWSHDLLAGDERIVFRRLGVFVGGAPLEAVGAVCGPAEPPGAGAVDSVEALVDQGLVFEEEQSDGGPRVGMLETVREFALERLDAAGERTATGAAHAAWFVAFAERNRPTPGPEQPARLAALEREQDNLRAALRWAVERGDAPTGLRLGAALWLYWHVRGRWREGQRWLGAVLGLPGRPSGPAAARAEALHGAGVLATFLLDWAAARASLEESLAISRAVGNAAAEAWVLDSLAHLAYRRGARSAVGRLARRALARFRALGDRSGMAAALRHLALAAEAAGEIGRAEALADEGLLLAREAGDPWYTAHLLRVLGSSASARGDTARAQRLLDESLALFQDLGDSPAVWRLQALMPAGPPVEGSARARALLAEALPLLRAAAASPGAPEPAPGRRPRTARAGADRARAVLGRGVLDRGIGSEMVVIVALERLSGEALARGQLERVARLSAAAAELRAATGAPRLAAERALHDRCVGAARAGLGEEHFAAAWAEGVAMTLEQVVAYALGDDESEAGTTV
jgi:predicted ATPase